MDLTSDDGTPTGTIFGFTRSLGFVMNKVGAEPATTALVWDGGHSEKRIALYPEYKQGRRLNTPVTLEEKARAEDYRRQMDVIKEMMSHREFKQLCVPGVEADDLLTIFANTLRTKNRVVIFSGDRDLWQVTLANTLIFDPKIEVVGQAKVLEKFGVEASRLVMWKALVGDTSDNIKGVPQIGAKRAVKVMRYLDGELRKTGVPIEEKDEKWVTHVLLHRDVVERNLKIMRLPYTWDQSFYSLEQSEQALEQWLRPSVRDTRKFLGMMARFNIESFVTASW
jgi:5'-3' exonuclease